MSRNQRNQRFHNKNPRRGHGTKVWYPQVDTSQITTRAVWALRSDIRLSEEVQTVDQSYMATGTYFYAGGINYRIKECALDDILTAYDSYRIDLVEVYAQVNDASDHVTLFSAFDPDDSNTTNWREMSRRQNVTVTILKKTNKRKLIAKYKPRINFNNTGTGGQDSPQNVVPASGTWVDCASNFQSHNGTKIFASSQARFSIDFHMRFRISFRGKI